MTTDLALEITLIKTDTTFGRLRAGAKFTAKHPADTPHHEAVQRTFAMLARYSPAENPECWAEEDVDVSE